MKTLTIALFASILAVSASAETLPVSKPKNPNAEFVKQFYAQVDNTNKALENVVGLPCSVEKATLDASLDQLIDAMTRLGDLAENIPTTQDVTDQIKELETFYGLNYLSKKFITARFDACAPPPEPDSPNTTTAVKN